MEIKVVKRGECPTRLGTPGDQMGGCRATDREGARAHLRRQMDQENFQGALHRMKPKFALLTALVAGLLPVAAIAQAAPAEPQPAAPAASSAPAPRARRGTAAAPHASPRPCSSVGVSLADRDHRLRVGRPRDQRRPARGGRSAEEVPTAEDQLQKLAAEIDSLKRQLQAAPATLSDEEAPRGRRTSTPRTNSINATPRTSRTLRRPTFRRRWGRWREGRCGDEEVRER